jgi:hypothetical protein
VIAKEYTEGWETGVSDAFNGNGCRFQDQHSDYAKGYYDGFWFTCLKLGFLADELTKEI